MEKSYLCKGRYEILPSLFQEGHGGIPGIARDVKTDTIVFTKRTEVLSQSYRTQLNSLQKEANALKELAGFHTPLLLEICKDTDISGDRSSESFCLILENIADADCVDDIYYELSLIERIEILNQLFSCLANAHSKQIANNDISIGHLYWKRDRLHLVVIDWGNSKTVVHQQEFEDDFSRAGEVVYTLLTLKSFSSDPSANQTPLPESTPNELRTLINFSIDSKNSTPFLLKATKLEAVTQQWKSNLVNEVLTKADRVYLSGKFEAALNFYREVLKWEPRNTRANSQLIKAKFSRSEDLEQGIPREAMVLYRRARSHIAAGDLVSAVKILESAVQLAKEAGADFRDARYLLQELQFELQNALLAENYFSKAQMFIHRKEWARALRELEQAEAIDPTKRQYRILLQNLRNLLRARSLIEQLKAKVGNENDLNGFIYEIEKIIEASKEDVQLEPLWNEIIQNYSEVQDTNFETASGKGLSGTGQLKISKQHKLLFRGMLWGIISFSLLLIGFLWIVYLVPKQSVIADCNSINQSLSATLIFNSYLANGDEGEIRITFENSINSTQAISETLLLNFEGPADVTVSSSSSNVLELTSLEPGEQDTKLIKFSFNEPIKLIADPSQYLEFSLLSQGSRQKCTPEMFSIAMAPVYGLQKLFVFLWGSLGITFFGLFWERIKKFLNNAK